MDLYQKSGVSSFYCSVPWFLLPSTVLIANTLNPVKEAVVGASVWQLFYNVHLKLRKK